MHYIPVQTLNYATVAHCGECPAAHPWHKNTTFPLVRVNHFTMMARLAQYWLMDFYSRVLDQRMSIIGKIRNRILMGQMRQTSDDLTEHEEQDRRAAGYIRFHKLLVRFQLFELLLKIIFVAVRESQNYSY